MRLAVLGLALTLVAGVGGVALPEPPAAADGVAGCRVSPADNYWRADVSDLPRHRRNRQWLARMSPNRRLHPDFGPSFGNGPDYGLPITAVGHRHRRVRVRFTYAAESTTRRNGRWRAGSGATWSLGSNRLRPDGWTSADAAGLPILPGLLRWREVRRRDVDHAIRFTTDVTSRWHVWPARHDAGSRDSHRFPPMGARFRLKGSYRPPRSFGPGAREVVRAMKTYGLVLADNGSPWFFQGERNAHWPDRLIVDLKRVPASAFVAVDTSSLKVDPDSAATR